MRRSRTLTRQCILDAAYGLFWRHGFLRVSMDDIAARADLTKRALYQHFRSKDDLITAALAHSSDLAIARLRGFPSPHERGRPDRFLLHRASAVGGEAEVVGRRFHSCCRGACRSPRSPRPCDRAPAQDSCGEMACGRARRRSYSLAARSSTRSHAAHGRHDGADAHSRRSQLRQSSSARRQNTRSKKVGQAMTPAFRLTTDRLSVLRRPRSFPGGHPFSCG